MDTLSHALWGRGLFGYRGYKWLAIFFGAMPDLASFGALIFINIITGNIPEFGGGPPPLDSLPNWVFLSYDIFHSYVTAFSIIALVYYFNKNFAFSMLGWPFHIIANFLNQIYQRILVLHERPQQKQKRIYYLERLLHHELFFLYF